MTDQPPNAQAPDAQAPDTKPAKVMAAPVARLPAVVASTQNPGDSLARILGALALAGSIGVGAYVYHQPAPPTGAVTPQDWQTAQQRAQAMAQELIVLRQNLQALQEHAVTAAPPPTPALDRMAAEQERGALTEIAKLQAVLAEMKSGIASATAAQQEMTQLKHDLAVANTAIAAVHAQIQKMTHTAHAAATAENTTRAQVIAYLQLRNAAATATPFADELQALAKAAKTVADIPGIVVRLENAAHAGVATLPMLQARFNVMSGPAEQAVELATAQGWWEKMAANMQEIVSIRKVSRDGNGPGKALHNAAAALQRGNIAGAVTQIEGLPPAALTHMQEWLTDAKARIALDAALAQIGVLLGHSAGQSEASPPAESKTQEPPAPESGTP